MEFTTSQADVFQEIAEQETQGDNAVPTKNAPEPLEKENSIELFSNFFFCFFQKVKEHNALVGSRAELEPIQFKQVANFIVGEKLTIELVKVIGGEKVILFIYTKTIRYCTANTPKRLFDLVYMLSQGEELFEFEKDKIPTWQDTQEQ
jgi:hypothetical protein